MASSGNVEWDCPDDCWICTRNDEDTADPTESEASDEH